MKRPCHPLWLNLRALSLAAVSCCAQAQTAPADGPAGAAPAPAAPAATAPSAPASPAASATPAQRVPFITEAMKAQLRQELREEIIELARAERWGTPGAGPSWVERLRIEGDIRFRLQGDLPHSGNTPAANYQASVADTSQGLMRAPEFALSDSANNTRASTEDGRVRERLRLRLGLTAKVSDEVGVGVRLSTGNADDRVSTNQTLGNNFNKYALFVDRAFIKLDPTDWVSASFGRVPNPWFSTDMVWSENLNFEGMSLKAMLPPDPEQTFEPYLTVGSFPLRDRLSPLRSARWLHGAQTGAAWQLDGRTRIKGGLAYYVYNNIAGREDTDYRIENNSFVAGPSFGQYAYTPGSLGQKGNTLFETNPVSAPLQSNGLPYYGLAYNFRPLVLTLAAEFTHFSPFNLLATYEYVRNTAFSVSDFQRRAGSSYAGVNPGGRATGHHLRLAVGSTEVRDEGQWQLFVTYKRVGSDAVVDAFTDSDMGLGGTNIQGYTLGGQYGLYRNTAVGLRALSAKTIDSPINMYGNNASARYGVSTVQVDLNVRF